MSARKIKREELYHFVFTSFAIVVLSLAMFLMSNHFENIKPQVKVLGAQIDLEQERKFWQTILRDHPTYRDGWLELAKIEEEMGNQDLAERYTVKAVTIDPNYLPEF